MNKHDVFDLSSGRLVALCAALALGGALLAPPVWAAPARTPEVPATTQAKYLNGGIGQGSQDQMKAAAHEWPLRMTFSEHQEGAYVADVKLRVVDHTGKEVLQLADAGPITYVRVPRGQYRVTADYKGKQLVREVDVGDRGVNVSFNWR